MNDIDFRDMSCLFCHYRDITEGSIFYINSKSDSKSGLISDAWLCLGRAHYLRIRAWIRAPDCWADHNVIWTTTYASYGGQCWYRDVTVQARMECNEHHVGSVCGWCWSPTAYSDGGLWHCHVWWAQNASKMCSVVSSTQAGIQRTKFQSTSWFRHLTDENSLKTSEQGTWTEYVKECWEYHFKIG